MNGEVGHEEDDDTSANTGNILEDLDRQMTDLQQVGETQRYDWFLYSIFSDNLFLLSDLGSLM